MASASSPKVPCATCGDKGVGIFKCEGCAQAFCRKHVIEHRDKLSHQLDEIVLEFDVLQQTIAENQEKPNHSYPLIEQIDQWERNAIEKIQQTAKEARQEVHKLTGTSKETASKELHDLAVRLQKAREDDDYVETDLRTWTMKLERLKHDVTDVSSSMSVCEDSTKILIGKMYVSSPRSNLTQEERFGDFFGDIHIEDNGHVASYSGFDRCDAYVRGTGEYSKGKHIILFAIYKKTTSYVMSFHIVSKSTPLSSMSSDDKRSIYGWQTDDGINNPDKDQRVKKTFKDFRDKTTFALELTLDCDNRKISYCNKLTKNTHEMNVNIDKCPFPWQLEFYLFNIGDRIQLMSSEHLY